MTNWFDPYTGDSDVLTNKLSTSGSGQNNYINNYDWNSQTVSSGYRYCANEYGLYCFQPYPDHGGYLGPMIEMYSIYKGPKYFGTGTK